MQLIHYKDWRGNFGDDINVPFFDTVAPGWAGVYPGKRLFGIGTLLNESKSPFTDSVIFGSGFGQGHTASLDASATVLGVRGYRTAKTLGLSDDSLVIGDPALHLPALEGLISGRRLTGSRVVVALHHKTAELWDFGKANSSHYYFLDPGLTAPGDYVSTIRGSTLVLCEAMHAAIVAVAFGVPFIPVSLNVPTDETKWRDFLESVGITSFSRNIMPCPGPRLWRKCLTGLVHRGYGKGVVPRNGASISQAEVDALHASVTQLGSRQDPLVAPKEHLDVLWERRTRAIARLRNLIEAGQTGNS